MLFIKVYYIEFPIRIRGFPIRFLTPPAETAAATREEMDVESDFLAVLAGQSAQHLNDATQSRMLASTSSGSAASSGSS